MLDRHIKNDILPANGGENGWISPQHIIWHLTPPSWHTRTWVTFWHWTSSLILKEHLIFCTATLYLSSIACSCFLINASAHLTPLFFRYDLAFVKIVVIIVKPRLSCQVIYVNFLRVLQILNPPFYSISNLPKEYAFDLAQLFSGVRRPVLHENNI